MSRPRNARGEALICAQCGMQAIESLEAIGLRWKTALSGYFMSFRRDTIKEGDLIPVGYGIAYYEPGRDVAVIMPVPFNLIVGAWRALRWHVTCPPWHFAEVRALRSLQAYDYGYEKGRADEARFNGHLKFNERMRENTAGYARGVGEALKIIREERAREQQ